MVAYIMARSTARAALAYYDLLRGDDDDTRVREPPGRWAGESAERLSLRGPITRTEFKSALRGVDPKTGERLVRLGPGHKHSAGWDMMIGAPKSVSVLWALTNEWERPAIEHTHRSAVRSAASYLERTRAWTRRGPMRRREQLAGLLMAQFDHHTSRACDPHLHTHSMIFNLAPRWDGSWGAIADRELYRAQKDADAVYLRALGSGLERLGYRLDRENGGFHVALIPRDIERAFSKRQMEIAEAARAFGYQTAKSLQVAQLRTLGAKGEAKLDGLFKTWEAEARGLGFVLSPQRLHARSFVSAVEPSRSAAMWDRFGASVRSESSDAAVATMPQTAAQLGRQLGQALRSLDQPSGMSGIKVRIRQSDRELEWE